MPPGRMQGPHAGVTQAIWTRMRASTLLPCALFGAALVATLLVAGNPSRPGDESAKAAPGALAPAAERAPADDSALSRPPVHRPRARAEVHLRWARTRLAAAFDEAPDLRAFAIEAERRPAEGGVFHALRALAECRMRPPIDLPPSAVADAQTSHLRLQAQAAGNDRLARRCAAFVADDLADAEVERLAALGRGAGDPLVASFALWLHAVQEGTLPAIANALAVALRTEDAALLELVAITGQDYLSAGGAAADDADESQARVRHAAWRLLPCELGAGCATPRGPPDELCERSARCAQARWGTGPRLDPPAANSEMERILAEVARLRRAVQGGDAGAVLGLPPWPATEAGTR